MNKMKIYQNFAPIFIYLLAKKKKLSAKFLKHFLSFVSWVFQVFKLRVWMLKLSITFTWVYTVLKSKIVGDQWLFSYKSMLRIQRFWFKTVVLTQTVQMSLLKNCPVWFLDIDVVLISLFEKMFTNPMKKPL